MHAWAGILVMMCWSSTGLYGRAVLANPSLQLGWFSWVTKLGASPRCLLLTMYLAGCTHTCIHTHTHTHVRAQCCRYLHAVNSTTGKLLFKFETCANVFASAALADNGMVYIGCNTATGDRKPGIGAMYAINPTKHL